MIDLWFVMKAYKCFPLPMKKYLHHILVANQFVADASCLSPCLGIRVDCWVMFGRVRGSENAVVLDRRIFAEDKLSLVSWLLIYILCQHNFRESVYAILIC